MHMSTLTYSSQTYEYTHNKQMPIKSIARMIQTMLYGRRFFPYYVYNILGGIEEDGECDKSLQRPMLNPRNGCCLFLRSRRQLRA